MLGWLCSALETVETDTFNRFAISLIVAGFWSMKALQNNDKKNVLAFGLSLLKLTTNSLAMNRVADIIARKGVSAIAVPPDTPIIDALQIMADKNIGSVLVMDGGEYVGVMTERDYSRKVILKGKNSHDTKVADIMSTDLPAVKPSDSVEHCMQLMTERNIRYLPVFENELLAGIISMSDVVKQTILAQQETINHLNDYIHFNR